MSKIPKMLNQKDAIGISVLRLGTHGSNKRVWITNKKLQEVFIPGEKVNIFYSKDSRQINLTRADLLGGDLTISKRGNGTPIIDLKNQEVEKTFGSGIQKIEVLFFKDEIVIKVAKTEKFKEKRAAKTGLNTFELFSGTGTLSSMFESIKGKNGEQFNVKGALELNSDYLAMFHANHKNEEIFSINANLEDIHSSYFPTDIDVVLSGIPCTSYSASNLKLKKAQKAKREGKQFDENEIAKEYQAEALTFYVLQAIKTMNPHTVVVEEVLEYSESPASMMLKTILSQMGYLISEAVAEGTHTKRKRWVLVANMGQKVDLNNLIKEDGKTIADFLETSVDDRDWKSKEHFAPSRLNEKIGIRSSTPTDIKTNTFTTHSTRGTEPILQKEKGVDLYSEFTNREIANLHGLSHKFVLDKRKSIARQCLGQGVTDAFKIVAERIIEANKDSAA